MAHHNGKLMNILMHQYGETPTPPLPTRCEIHQCDYVDGQCPRCQKRLRGICDVCDNYMTHHRDRGYICHVCERVQRQGFDPRQPYLKDRDGKWSANRDYPATFNKGRKVAKKRGNTRPL